MPSFEKVAAAAPLSPDSMPTHTNGAIVLGTEVNGIAVIRSLGRLGVRCGAITSTVRGDHAHRSRYLKDLYRIRPSASDNEIQDALRGISSRMATSRPVVIPTTDRFSEFLSRNWDSLMRDFLPCCPDANTCDTFLDKWKTAEVCRLHDVSIPMTSCPRSNDELREVADSFEFPVVVKPRYTYGNAFPGKNAVFSSARELVAFLQDSPLLGHCVVQQVIPSGDGDILVVASYSGADGKVRAMYSGRKIRQLLPDYGATCFGLSERHPELEIEAANFLDGIRYRGFAAIEYARSRTNGNKYFIELNTRTYYHNQLFADVGIDLTQVAYVDLTGTEVPGAREELRQKEGVFWLDFRRDFQSMRLKRRQGRITAFGWFKSILKARSFAYWNASDPLPFLAACGWKSVDTLLNVLRRLGIAPGA